MSPRIDVSQERRDQILKAAVIVFARQGFHGARMDDIVAESGLSKGTLYWYFNSKDDIIQTVLEQFFSHEMDVLAQILNMKGTLRERLHRLIDQLISDTEHMAPLLSITFEFFSLAARQDKAKESIRNYYRQFRLGLTAIFQQGLDSGELEGPSAKIAAINLLAQFEGLVLLWALDPSEINLREQAFSAISIMPYSTIQSNHGEEHG